MASYNGVVPESEQLLKETPKSKKSTKFVIVAAACLAGAAIATSFKPAAAVGGTKLSSDDDENVVLQASHGEWCLDIWGNNPYDGAPVQLWGCGPWNKHWKYIVGQTTMGQTHQLMYRNPDPSGPNFCLDCYNGGNGCEKGGQLHLWTCDQSYPDQDWSQVAGRLKFSSTMLCADVAGGNWAEGTSIWAWTCAEDDQTDTLKNQRWEPLSRCPFNPYQNDC